MSDPIIELTVRGSDKIVAHACGKCRRVAHDERMAKECCEPTVCKCGAICSRGWTSCEDCRDKKIVENERKRFEKAKKVNWRDYDGPVYWEGPGGDYWHTTDDLLDGLECEILPEDYPSYVWACSRFGLGLNAEDIIEQQLEQQEHHEDASDWIVRLDELQKSMDEWLERQSVESYMVDYKRAVLLDGIVDEI